MEPGSLRALLVWYSVEANLAARTTCIVFSWDQAHCMHGLWSVVGAELAACTAYPSSIGCEGAHALLPSWKGLGCCLTCRGAELACAVRACMLTSSLASSLAPSSLAPNSLAPCSPALPPWPLCLALRVAHLPIQFPPCCASSRSLRACARAIPTLPCKTKGRITDVPYRTARLHRPHGFHAPILHPPRAP